jgi:hypothetical protein
VIFVEEIAELPRVRAAQLWFTSRRDDENACENNAPTVPQPGRTSRPFILPSDGRVAASFSTRTFICAHLHFPTMLYDKRHCADSPDERRTNSSRSRAFRSETVVLDDTASGGAAGCEATVALRSGSLF